MLNDKSMLSAYSCGGCDAKLGPGELSELLLHIPKISSPNLMIGYQDCDDAAVYRLDKQHALVSTVDFFVPMVDDPKTFGRIAAANALSDIYAMGAVPILALNLLCMPEHVPPSVVKEILAGGAEKIREAGAVIGGGHSIYDSSFKYGLSVTGTAHPDQIIRNNTPKAGHCLILTKPLGVGIIMAAARAGLAAPAALQEAVTCMEQLNRYASQSMRNYDVSACTDVTGFGLLGHLLELCGTQFSASIAISSIPVITSALAYADAYLLTSGGQRNRNYLKDKIDIASLSFAMQEVLLDPQTSGGLLICMAENDADAFLHDIHTTDPYAKIIGRITTYDGQPIHFTKEF